MAAASGIEVVASAATETGSGNGNGRKRGQTETGNAVRTLFHDGNGRKRKRKRGQDSFSRKRETGSGLFFTSGQVMEQGPADAIFERPQHPYTRALMAAAFDIEAVDTDFVAA